MRLDDDGCPHVRDVPVPTRLTEEEVRAVLAGHEEMCWWLAKKSYRGGDPGALEEVAAEVRAQFVFAARRFDPSRGRQFSTFAMRVSLARARRQTQLDAVRGLHVPTYLLGKVAVKAPGSLDAEMRNRGRGCDDSPAGDVLAVAPEPEPAPEFPPDFWERVTKRLHARQREALLLRHRDGLTLREAGERMKLTKERVRQLEARALKALAGDPDVRRMAEQA